MFINSTNKTKTMQDQQKQQIAEQLRTANNVLVTVKSNPTVDELAAAIGLSLALNKLDKRATTVFSGVVPSTIEFLQPEKTIETTTDSLRDFIIALDKSKADKLRYKVEDDVVRIFITPYRTSISDKDLEYSQGDFNVDVVIALGVNKREDLDRAITAHGRILHDAVVISLTNRDPASELGTMHWQDNGASSLCEMAASLVNDLQQGLLDAQMATALLTGIVAETDRFKNEKTTPLALSLSAQLMSSGANQQLIAEKLDHPISPPQPLPEEPSSDMPPEEQSDVHISDDGELEIDHKNDIQDIHIDEHGNLNVVEAPPTDDRADSYEAEDRYQPNDTSDYQTAQQESYTTENETLPVDTPRPPAEYLQAAVREPLDSADAGDSFNIMDGVEEQAPTDSNGMSMQHHKVIRPLGSNPADDRPFDLQAAIEAEAAAERTRQQAGDVVPTTPSQQPPQTPDAYVEDTPLPAVEEPDPPKVPEPVAVEPPVAQTPPQPSPEPNEIEQTLKDLELAVNSPHVQHEAPLDEQAIRDSVAQAADAVRPEFPTPKADIASTPVEILTPEAAVPPPVSEPVVAIPPPTPEANPDSPPPVPPPMMPQFYDANGKNDDPFTAK